MDGEIQRLIQIGEVSDIDYAAHKVRVIFRDTGMTSDWLCVLKTPSSISTGYAGAHNHDGSVTIHSAGGHTHSASTNVASADGHTHGASTDIHESGSHNHGATASIGVAEGHQHNVYVTAWMPQIHDTVLVVYLPVYNSDGFVIGGI